jgi:LysM repeat protein
MKYVVKSGDTLSKLAAQYLGSSDRYTKIMAVNPQILSPNLIKIGQTIEIPVATSVRSATSSLTSSSFNIKNYVEKLKDPKVATVVVLLGLGAFYLYQKNYRTA